MINKREVLVLAVVIVVITLSINLSLSIFTEWQTLLYSLAAVAVVILGNVFAKKLMAYRLDSEIEMKIWEVGKVGFTKDKNDKKPFPLGAILPLISKIILFPFKSFVWMACLVFDIKPRIYRGAKRHGLYTFSEITESHIGIIAAAGIIVNLILAVIGYFAGFSLFARLNIYYAFFNMLPLSEFDGNKIFFGNLIFWSFLASLTLIGLLMAIFII